jgi:hypothetical protein
MRVQISKKLFTAAPERSNIPTPGIPSVGTDKDKYIFILSFKRSATTCCDLGQIYNVKSKKSHDNNAGFTETA